MFLHGQIIAIQRQDDLSRIQKTADLYHSSEEKAVQLFSILRCPAAI